MFTIWVAKGSEGEVGLRYSGGLERGKTTECGGIFDLDYLHRLHNFGFRFGGLLVVVRRGVQFALIGVRELEAQHMAIGGYRSALRSGNEDFCCGQ